MAVSVKTLEIKSRFILAYYGAELQDEVKSFNRILEWKTYSGAKKFLMNNEFILNGELLNKDNVDIVELKELKQDD